MLRGAIFDADGTLLDSMHIWHELGARYLAGLNITPEENLSRILYPMSLEQGSEYLREKYKLKHSREKIRENLIKIIEHFYVHEVELKSFVTEFLEVLNKNNVSIVIATSGDRELLNAALTRNNVNKYFDAVFTCSELGTNKHEPKIYLECAKFMGLAPGKIAVFEDALFAIRTAKSAGFVTVGVEDESNLYARDEIINTADYYIKQN